MARILFFVGGSRSGKSAQALREAEALPGPRCFLATCPVTDDEMRHRIRRHQEARRTGAWDTVEEPLELAAALRGLPDHPVVLVDCLTLWVNNLLFHTRPPLEEDDVAARTQEVLAACRDRAGTVLLVSSEVGLGIVPADAATRRYRDLLGRANQVVAAHADTVTFMACGLPLPLKTNPTGGTLS